MGPYGTSVWKGILKISKWFHSNISFRVGNGASICFWTDLWEGSSTIAADFPQIFRLSKLKDGSVQDHMHFQDGGYSWNLRLRRHLNDWEIDLVASLIQCLESKPIGTTEEVDERRWNCDKDGFFSVRSAYIKLMDDQIFFPHEQIIWFPKMPSKASFLIWLVLLDKVLTVDKLQARGWHLVNRCSLCLSNEETASHLFLHCEVAHKVWCYFRSRFNQPWVKPKSMDGLLFAWCPDSDPDLSKGGKLLLFCIPTIVCWMLWRKGMPLFLTKAEWSMRKP